MFSFPRAVWLLGWVSLATDSATEAIYPLLPFFLTRVLGAGAVSLGIIEGAAEAVNSILKVISGRMADRAPAKRPLVIAGYSVSSIARPFIAITTTWPQVFAVRVLDRVGKGVRGAPRDAILASWATPQTRGAVYGFHRAMDHAGAVIGPALAALYLFAFPGAYRSLFALTIVPGAIAVALLFLVPERSPAGDRGLGTGDRKFASDRLRLSDPQSPIPNPQSPTANPQSPTPNPHAPAPDPLPRRFTVFMLVLTLFTLGNSTDAFLLLRLTDAAGSAKYVPLMWAALHIVKATTSVVGGSWSDRIGRRGVIAAGWLIYAAVYAGFASSASLAALFSWFLVYGLYFGFAEGTEKALVADLAPASRRGFAFGVYNAVQGVGALAASVVFGLIWNAFGAAVAFATGAALALVATALLWATI